MNEPVPDHVILVDDDDHELGTADRLAVHDGATPLHRAFSLYLFDDDGRVLITRRALHKKTWPGVWTNSCCWHPRHGETRAEAIARRLPEELGDSVGVVGLTEVLPDFRYRAVDASGTVENEICPVFTGRLVGELSPNPDEVAEVAWVSWEDLLAAAGATPRVYSPWSVEQLAQLATVTPPTTLAVSALEKGQPDMARPSEKTSATSVEVTLRAVDDLLAHEHADLSAVWRRFAPAPVDILGDDPGDLPAWLQSSLTNGGKRLRPRMCHWGFVASGGTCGGPGHDATVRAAAALELLHQFALVHDDVMDRSDRRRGQPSAHMVATTRHRIERGRGGARRFGRNLAVLLGDLAHAEAERVAQSLPADMRGVWHELKVELIAGQRADLTGAAGGRTDLAHAEAVAALKSGAYTVERPLQLGALAAGANADQLRSLARYGWHLGRAFAWRDDVLGVWGDPDVTGKPSGDDLVDGKTTLIWILGRERLSGEAATALERVSTDDIGPGDVAFVQQGLIDAGVLDELERRISAELTAADAVLDAADLTDTGVAGLRELSRSIVWRDS